MCQPEAIEILNEVFRQCQNIFPCEIRDAYLYGSYARGDYDNESDVDILLTVDLEPTEISRYRNQIAAISSDLSLAHDVTVSITVKSFDCFHRYSTVLPFLQKCVGRGNTLHCGSRRFRAQMIIGVACGLLYIPKLPISHKWRLNMMSDMILTTEEIRLAILPLLKKYRAEKAILFGSYARNEADAKSDIDLLIIGGKDFIPTDVFCIADELYRTLAKRVDVYELCEINPGSDFYNRIFAEGLRIT